MPTVTPESRYRAVPPPPDLLAILRDAADPELPQSNRTTPRMFLPAFMSSKPTATCSSE